MTASINASTSSGLVLTSDLSGSLALQSNGSTVATVASTGFSLPTNNTLNAANTFGFKNRLINGNMVIDQRNAGASVTPTNQQYVLDRWSCYQSTASKFSVQQNAGSVTPPVGFTNYLGCTSLSAYSVSASDNFGIYQRIEGFNIADLAWGTANAKTVTLSFQVYSSLTGTFGGSLNNAGARAYPFTYSIPVANTWTSISVTVAGDTSGTWLTTNGIGLQASFGIGVGSTYSGTAGSWQAGFYASATGATSVVGTSGATWYITGVQFEIGSQATTFDFRSITQETALCQRYFQKWNGATSRKWIMNGMALSTTANYGTYFLKVTMRADPTLGTSGTASDYCLYQGNTLFTCSTVPGINTSSVDTPNIGWPVTGGTDGKAVQMGSNTDNGSLTFTAEL